MRYFVIATLGDTPENVAVVFHDYVEGYVLCRSRKRSFYEAFNVVSSRIHSILVKTSGRVLIQPFGVKDFSWIERVLFETCGLYWIVSHEGKVAGSEASVDEVVRRYLS
jgi:hypothetical protein